MHYVLRSLLAACIALLFPFLGTAQFTDDFTDGDFSAAPVWSGSTTQFIVVPDVSNNRLRSNSPGAATYQLTTPSALASNARWEWFADLRFATSSANFVDVYLISDNADLSLTLNGWFVRMGGTADVIELFKRVGGVNTSVVVSPAGIVNSSSTNPFKIRVERSTANAWTLSYDDGNLGTFVDLPPVTDTDITTSTHFGISIVQSTLAGAVNGHFFDDFFAGIIPVDLAPPTIVAVEVIDALNIDVVFDEPVDPTTANVASNYDIQPFLSATAAVRDAIQFNRVHLTLISALTGGNTYTLIINGVEDLVGNAMASASFPFTYAVPEQPAYRDVVINEIFADPSPVIGLPEVEYIELYNATTNKTFDLDGWTFSDGGTPVLLPSYTLLPGEYVLVIAAANLPVFATVPNKLGITSLPALNNDGDALVLTDNVLTTIDAVTYALSWYQDGIKDDGGGSLEQIDPTSPCSGASNWRASVAPAGGTPGTQNSIFAIIPDTQPPSLLNVQVVSPTSLIVVFSEAMDASSLVGANYFITPLIATGDVFPNVTNGATVELLQPLVEGVVYTLVVEDASDCTGNLISTNNTVNFALPEPVDSGDVVINEVLYDPVVDGSDFIELYNRSQKTLTLAGMQLANITGGVIASPTAINSALLLLPGEYVVITTNAANIASVYPQSRTERFVENALPSYNNGEGSVVLLAPDGSTLDRFNYTDDLHFELVNNPEGYSLERVDPDRPTDDNSNWQTASDVAGRATPGYRNSQYSETADPSGELTIEPAIFSPDNDGYQDVLTIAYTFNEPGFVGNMIVYDIAGREAIKLMENLQLGTQGAISWDGIMDGGSLARMGPYIVVLEVFDLAGNVEKYKKTVTLAHRLD
ncbi:MAG: lamin tail domain-containing protein [Flavobacteriales bacterium]|nr:lamin tail domain-containing protein [Flavobacteriales bacterium]